MSQSTCNNQNLGHLHAVTDHKITLKPTDPHRITPINNSPILVRLEDKIIRFTAFTDHVFLRFFLFPAGHDHSHGHSHGGDEHSHEHDPLRSASADHYHHHHQH